MATIAQQPAKIYLADKRPGHESYEYRCLSTPVHEKGGDEDILRFSDETLAPHKSISFSMDEDTSLILMPLVGTIAYGSFEAEDPETISPEELHIVFLKKGEQFSIKNTDSHNLVNYLQIWLRPGLEAKKVSFKKYSPNAVNTIFESGRLKIHFGVLDGRTETYLTPSDAKNTLMSFIINGAFEVQGRLLESRDSLVMWDMGKLEVEALSENALILILEKNNSC